MRMLSWQLYWLSMAFFMVSSVQAREMAPLLIVEDSPALLDYDIDQEKRSDLRTCGVSNDYDWRSYPFQFDSAIKDCWPNLVIAKRYVRLFYNYGEASWNQKDATIARRFRDKAFGQIAVIRKEHTQPIWPFEKLMVANSYDIEAMFLKDSGEFVKAAEAKAAEIRILEDLRQNTNLAYRLPVKRFDKAKLQLKLGRSETVRQEMDAAYPHGFVTDDWFSFYSIMAHVSAVANDAASSGSKEYALDLLDRFISSMDKITPDLQRDIRQLQKLRAKLSEP